MPRWTQTWLGGTSPAVGARTPGSRLGLPADGPGAAASFGPRAAAFAVDAIASGLVARLFFPVRSTARLSDGLAPVVVLAVVYLVGVALTGQTLGMRLLRLRVAALPDTGRPPAPVAVALRTALLFLLVPAVISDADGRGLHDRAAGTVVVQAPRRPRT